MSIESIMNFVYWDYKDKSFFVIVIKHFKIT